MPIPKLLISAALFAANMALTMTKKIEGPRLDDLKFTGGDYGAPLAMVWGARRLQVPIFWAENLTEVRRERKTKGGKYNQYTYFGTWAVALAGHEIALARRIWFDTHLVYDVSGAGPVTPFDFGGDAGDISEFITIYLGTEDQETDPRMQATVEAAFGEGSCPAYRGTAYIVFKDIPLEKLGNRIPQVAVEVVTAAEPEWPWEEVPLPYDADGLYFSEDFSLLIAGGGFNVAIFDNPSRQVISDFPGNFSGISPRFALWEDGSFLALEGGPDTLAVYDVYGGRGSELGTDLRDISTVQDSDGVWHWAAYSNFSKWAYFDGAVIFTDLIGTQLFADLDGNVWLFGIPWDGGSGVVGTEARFEMVFGTATGAISLTVTGLPTAGGAGPGAVHYRDAERDQFVFSWADQSFAVSTVDGEILETLDDPHGFPSYRHLKPGATTAWFGFTQRRLSDFSIVREIDLDEAWDYPGLDADQGDLIYDPRNNALVLNGSEGPVWLFLDRYAPGTVTLGEIEADVAEMVGVEDYDFSDHTQIVPGWSATQGQASNIIEPLHPVYDATIRPHDFGIEGINYTGVAAGTLYTERFVAGDPRYTVKVRQAAELPRAVVVNYADSDAEQQPNNVRSDRPLDAMGGRGEQTLDLTTWVSDADVARSYGDRYFRRIWNERREVTLSLTAQQLGLEPGDLRTLDLDGNADTYRLISLKVRADDVLETEWKYDHPSLAVTDSAKGANFDGRTDPVISVPLLSRGFVLDVPYLVDADDQNPPIVYILAAPFAPGLWPGADIYQAVDGEYSDLIGSVPSTAPATWGYANDELPAANPWLWDRGNTLSVTLQSGSFTGCTEAQVDADERRNRLLIGRELVNFTTATLEEDGSWTLSGFKRGRRGTEWACDLHVEGEVVLLLATADDAAMELSEVGTDLSFKAITAGRTTGFPIPMKPFTGASLKPYAPCHLEAVKEDNGDWTLTWVRRTRVGGAWTSGTAIPLSELTEEYDVILSDGVDDVTKTVTSPTYTWTQADQITDVGAEVMEGDLEWTVFQISDAVDRGFAAEATA